MKLSFWTAEQYKHLQVVVTPPLFSSYIIVEVSPSKIKPLSISQTEKHTAPNYKYSNDLNNTDHFNIRSIYLRLGNLR